MSGLPEPVQHLIAQLERLPGIGPRTAERLALHLIQDQAPAVEALAQSMVRARQEVRPCERCGALTQSQPCPICASPQREGHVLCVVERATDVLSIEKTHVFRGRYHVLGGKLSPLNGIGPEDLRVRELEQRIADESVREVILALGADVEGDATGFYLAKRLARTDLRVTRLAHGIPAGTGLEFADELTLGQAIEDRRELRSST